MKIRRRLFTIRHIKEVEGIDKNLTERLGFYREMGDIMRKHRREELGT